MYEQSLGHTWPEADCKPSRLDPAETLERLQAISELELLDTPAEPAFDAIAQLAAQICETGMAAISLVCDDRQWFKASYGMPVRETPIEQSICAHVIDGTDILVVPDASRHAALRANELVWGDFGLRFYAGVPIHTRDGVPVGALCVLDTEARAQGLTAGQASALAALGKQVEAQFELRRLTKLQKRHIKRETQLCEELERIVNRDWLTGLPDIRMFRLEFEKELGKRGIQRHPPALLLIDIARFKSINDRSGHEVGDLVLVEVAKRLKGALGSDAVTARVGSDLFAVMIPGCASLNHVAKVAEGLLDAVNLPFYHDGRAISFEIALGYALGSRERIEFASLFRRADLALAHAKASGHGCARGFSAALARVRDHKQEMIDRAQDALARDAIVPYYQPKVNLETGQLIGFEALLRIQTSDGHIELPATVAAAFEDRELAVAITDRMIDRVLSDMSTTTACGIEIGHVAINTTSSDFAARNFAEQLCSKLEKTGTTPSMVEVEVTESVVMGRGRDHVRHSLVALADAGVRISLDDFGTGYASLTNLKQLPISALKIDRSFVRELGNPVDDSIVIALTTLCARMGLAVVAEGIETEQQIALLRQFGVPYGQGMYFSSATPSADLGKLVRIAAGRSWAPDRLSDTKIAKIRSARGCRKVLPAVRDKLPTAT